MTRSTVSIVVPVFNGGEVWRRCAEALSRQTGCEFRTLVVDSGSVDSSTEVAVEYGFQLLEISKEEFDHGGTRQRAARILEDSEIIVYLTQDAVLEGTTSLARIVSAFDDPRVGTAYGRQLPREGAGPIEAHARLFNYPAESALKTLDDARRLGIKAAFTSNSFAAYRTTALFGVGGFPERLILAEDQVVAARMLKAGWAIAYVADACVRHSHDYSPVEEFKRYFDLGVFHRDHRWILDEFGQPEGEGVRYVMSELRYLAKRAPWAIPSAIARTAGKYAGYKLGQRYDRLPRSLWRKLSMHRRYWDRMERHSGLESI